MKRTALVLLAAALMSVGHSANASLVVNGELCPWVGIEGLTAEDIEELCNEWAKTSPPPPRTPCGPDPCTQPV